MNLKNWFAVIAIILVAILITGTAAPRGVLAFDPGGPPPAGGVPTVVTGNWEWINYQPTGGSYSPQQQINAANVELLELKWIFPYTTLADDEHGFNAGVQLGAQAPPLVIDGIVYVAKNDGRIHAVDALDGTEIWESEGISQVDWQALVDEFPYMQGSRGHTHALNYYREQGWLMMSNVSCYQSAWNIVDGSLAWEMFPAELCGTNEEMGNPTLAAAEPGQGIGTLGNQGQFPSIKNHPPSFMGDIMVIPVMGASGAGGRSSVRGYDMSDPANPIALWRTWLAPNADGSDVRWAIDQCDIVNGNGWYFETPEFMRSGQLAINCTDVPENVLLNDWININPNTPHFGKLHTSSAVAPVWGNMPISSTTGFIYLGTGDIGSYPNASYRYGPNLHGSGVVAIDVASGDLMWWYATNPHDLWDQDCSWGGILGNSGGQEVLIKACKNGMLYALNSLTGEPVWVFNPPNRELFLDWNWGADSDGNTANGCCDMTREHMSKPWMNCRTWDPDTMKCDNSELSHQDIVGPNAWAYTESDIAYDGVHVYQAVMNSPRLFTINNVRDFGNTGSTIEQIDPKNTTIWAVDINTGEPVWSYFLEGQSYRGGMMVTGGVVYAYASDGNLIMIDSATGELIHNKFFGVPVSAAPSIGADSEGNHKVFLHIGGGGGFLFSSTSLPGNLAAFGLPDVLPEPEIVEVIREIEVPGPERIVEVEVPGPERIVEVEVAGPEVEIQVISPISYVAIGLGVVLVVIAGVLFTRRRST